MKKLPKIDMKSLHMPEGMKRIVETLATGSHKVSYLGAAAGAGIDIVSATRDERGHLSELAKEYRPEIAERLGLAESQVTEAHYHQAFAENPVLAQAKDASSMKGGIRAINTTIASAVGVLAGLSASIVTRRAQSGGKQADAANIAGGVAATLAAAGAGKFARKVLHTRKIEGKLENTAHHQIMEIKGKQQRGEETTAADIFKVQLALNPDVSEALNQAAGKDFNAIEPAQQQALLQKEFPELFEINNEMARLINEEGMRPQQLVFGEIRAPEKPLPIEPVAPGHPDLPPNAEQQAPQAIEASGADAAAQALLDALNKGEIPVEQPVAPESETPRMAEPQKGELPESLKGGEEKGGADLERALQALQEGAAQQQPQGFAERINAQRSQAPDASLQR